MVKKNKLAYSLLLPAIILVFSTVVNSLGQGSLELTDNVAKLEVGARSFATVRMKG